LFDHTAETPPPELRPAAVALALIAEQAFAVSGGQSELGYRSGAPLINGVAVLVLGKNLFQTLMLNLVRYPHENTFVTDTDEDAPAWECDDRPIDGRHEPCGYLDYLTWLPRTIHLQPNEAGNVQWMSYAQGRKFAPKGQVYDPMMAYRHDENGDRAIRLRENRALWRDSAALFQTADQGQFRGPRNLAFIQELVAGGHLPLGQQYSLAAFGLCTDQAKVNLWRHETLPLPLDYLCDSQALQRLEDALAMADEVGRVLRNAIADLARKLLAPGEMPADSARVWTMVDSIGADRFYWARLETPFREFLVALPGDAEHQKKLTDAWFSETLCRSARNALNETAGRYDNSARALRAAVAGNRSLSISLATVANKANVQRPPNQGATA
jgi:CRISPR type I-E-associated protein CasA/Cse1